MSRLRPDLNAKGLDRASKHSHHKAMSKVKLTYRIIFGERQKKFMNKDPMLVMFQFNNKNRFIYRHRATVLTLQGLLISEP